MKNIVSFNPPIRFVFQYCNSREKTVIDHTGSSMKCSKKPLFRVNHPGKKSQCPYRPFAIASTEPTRRAETGKIRPLRGDMHCKHRTSGFLAIYHETLKKLKLPRCILFNFTHPILLSRFFQGHSNSMMTICFEGQLLIVVLFFDRNTNVYLSQPCHEVQLISTHIASNLISYR